MTLNGPSPGAFHAGTVANVIPNEATLLGTVRSLDSDVNKSLPERLERVVAGVCQATRAWYTFEFVQGYPDMVNDATFTHHAIDSVKALLDEDALPLGTAALARVATDYVHRGG